MKNSPFYIVAIMIAMAITLGYMLCSKHHGPKQHGYVKDSVNIDTTYPGIEKDPAP